MPEQVGSALHRRTLRFAVSIASLTCFPNKQLVGGHSIDRAYWYTFKGESKNTSDEDVQRIASTIKCLCDADTKIMETTLPYTEAHEWLESHQQPYAAALLRTNVQSQVALHTCANQYRLRHTPLLESMGQLTQIGPFQLKAFRNGFLAIYDPAGFKPQPAIAESFRDHMNWHNTNGVHCVGHINELRSKGGRGVKDYMLSAEFRQEDKIAHIANMINARGHGQPNSVRVLCIAGPTSSGKTTFATKLTMRLCNMGFTSKALSVDHYYFSLADQPKFKIRGERKDVDYDDIESIDVDLVGQHVTALIEGKTIMTPQYSFVSGNREGKGHEFTLPSNGILVMEGIHALNPDYTRGVPQECMFRIYISPLSGLQLDDFNAIKTTNHRFLRRLCRDSKFRGYTAQRVLEMWPKVRRGEHRYIFPHQNNADYVMNSCTEYELPVLKSFVTHVLQVVTPNQGEIFAHAEEVVALLDNFQAWPSDDVPSTSLLCEFIGNGAFDHH